MTDVLARICADKREHIARCKQQRPAAAIERAAKAPLESAPPRGFANALWRARQDGRYGLIAEIKKASPSKGLIRDDFHPPTLARAYHDGGATCLSVLTDGPYFQGDDAYIGAARDAVPLPVLRKDFILDPYQIAESRALGADCILLILAALTDEEAQGLMARAGEIWGMDVLVEIHDRAELDRALELEAPLIGINNRNLKTMAVDLATTEELAPLVPADRLAVAESGLSTPADLARMAAVGVTTFLIGESFMRQDDVAGAVRTMLTQPVSA